MCSAPFENSNLSQDSWGHYKGKASYGIDITNCGHFRPKVTLKFSIITFGRNLNPCCYLAFSGILYIFFLLKSLYFIRATKILYWNYGKKMINSNNKHSQLDIDYLTLHVSDLTMKSYLIKVKFGDTPLEEVTVTFLTFQIINTFALYWVTHIPFMRIM